jgi:hypothetical protein
MVLVGLSKIALWPTHPVKHCNRKCVKIKGTFGWGGCCIQFTLTVAGRPTKHCIGMPTARFFGGYAPAKALVSELSFAGTAASECWAFSSI